MTSEELQKLLDDATPGPWGCVDAAHFSLEKSRYVNGAFQVFGKRCDLHAVADCSCNHTCREPDECEANARLIAATPDLAAELIRVRQERDELQAAANYEGGPLRFWAAKAAKYVLQLSETRRAMLAETNALCQERDELREALWKAKCKLAEIEISEAEKTIDAALAKWGV